MIHVFTDGGSRGNPGPAAIGIYVVDVDKNLELLRFGKTIGKATNNVAEYTAVIEAYNWMMNNRKIIKNHKRVHFYLDSELVVLQLNGIYKIKNAVLYKLADTIRHQQQSIGMYAVYSHIPREKNTIADACVNRALDNT